MKVEEEFTYSRRYIRSLFGNVDILEGLVSSSRHKDISPVTTRDTGNDKRFRDFLCAILGGYPLTPVRNLLNDWRTDLGNSNRNITAEVSREIISVYSFFIQTLISLIPFYSTEFKVKSHIEDELHSIESEIILLVKDNVERSQQRI